METTELQKELDSLKVSLANAFEEINYSNKKAEKFLIEARAFQERIAHIEAVLSTNK